MIVSARCVLWKSWNDSSQGFEKINFKFKASLDENSDVLFL